jgi:hypothetical protein
MRQTRVTLLHYLAATDASTVLRGSKKSRMRMKALSTTTLSFPTISPLLTVGKNLVGYFLGRPCVVLIADSSGAVNPPG